RTGHIEPPFRRQRLPRSSRGQRFTTSFEGTMLRRCSRWFPACVVAMAACGPFRSESGAGQGDPSVPDPSDSPAPSDTPAADAGVGPPDGGGADPGAGGDRDGGAAPEILVIHDLHVEGLHAGVVY